MVILILAALYFTLCLLRFPQLLVYTGISLAMIWSILFLNMIYQRKWRRSSAGISSGTSSIEKDLSYSRR
ncbi:hypothetical protein BJX70DRAFT_48480 [Aspergillus crustosus]